MDRREFRASRMRNWLALLLMAVAAMAAGHSQAMTTPAAAAAVHAAD